MSEAESDLGKSSRRGPMSMDPRLDKFRLLASDRCWWCGARATTEEHRIKRSTLKRVATADSGHLDPRTVYKRSGDFEGLLRSINKGSQVRWPKNLCASCNNDRSQTFDYAYDAFERFILENADTMIDWKRLRWSDVYGPDWEGGAANLGRYFGKQIGCMLAAQRLPIPGDLIDFLNGAGRCPPIAFVIQMNWRAGYAHRMLRRLGTEEGVTSFVGLLPSNAYQTNDRFTGVTYGYHVGYVWFTAEWRDGSEQTSWWDYPEIDLPVVNGAFRDRLAWGARRVGPECRNLSRRGSDWLRRSAGW